MRICACLLVAVAVLAGCDGTDVVRVDGEHPPRRPEEGAMMPMCSSLYRVGGTHDPASPGYDPTVADTALLHVPHAFAWSGRDPHGICDPLLFRFRLDGGEFSVWAPDTTLVLDGLTDGDHDLTVQPGCPGVHGLGDGLGFVSNFDPDSRIVEPSEPSGTLTAPDGDTLWVRVIAHDREELEGVGGGIAEITITLDGTPITIPTTAAAEWWWNSNADPGSGHYISSVNPPQGGNAPHMVEAFATDVDGRSETYGESYMVRYNYPPVAHITYPAEGDTVGSDFTVLWDGYDPDSDIVTFQYVLDPWQSAYEITDAFEAAYSGIGSGPHEFRLRAKDGSGCYSERWSVVRFHVE